MVDLLHVTKTNISYLVIGAFAVIIAAFSLLVRQKLYLGEVVLGTAFGVIIGPYAANIFDPRGWAANSNPITLEVMRIVLAAGVFAIGIDLPKSYMWRKKRSLLITIVPTMAFGWVVSAAFMKVLFPRLTYISCLVICSTLTPTDPILSNSIITGKFAVKHVPEHLRLLLSAESAANDGLAYPFLSISMYLTLEAHKSVAIEKWFLIGWLYQVILGVVIGALVGRIFSYVMRYSRTHGFIDKESYVAQYIALALATTGLVGLLGSDDLLAAFAAGTAASWDGEFHEQTEGTVFSSVIDLLLNAACFIYIGAWLPFSSFNMPELGIVPWRLVVLFLILLLVRRIPAFLLIYPWVPDIHNWREALFCGHFGPMGVGAIFVSTLALTELGKPTIPPQVQVDILAASIQPIVSFVVLGSIMIHGLSIPFFTASRRVHTYSLTITRSLTHPAQPEWMSSMRRIDNATSLPVQMQSREAPVLPREQPRRASHELNKHIHENRDRVKVRGKSSKEPSEDSTGDVLEVGKETTIVDNDVVDIEVPSLLNVATPTSITVPQMASRISLSSPVAERSRPQAAPHVQHKLS